MSSSSEEEHTVPTKLDKKLKKEKKKEKETKKEKSNDRKKEKKSKRSREENNDSDEDIKQDKKPRVEEDISTSFSFNFTNSLDKLEEHNISNESQVQASDLRSLFNVYTDSDLANFSLTQGHAPKGVSGVVKAMADNMTHALARKNLNPLDLLQKEVDALDGIEKQSTENKGFSFGFNLGDTTSDNDSGFKFNFNAGLPSGTSSEEAPKQSLAAVFSETKKMQSTISELNELSTMNAPVTLAKIDLEEKQSEYADRKQNSFEKCLQVMDYVSNHDFSYTFVCPKYNDKQWEAIKVNNSAISNAFNFFSKSMSRSGSEYRNNHKKNKPKTTKSVK